MSTTGLVVGIDLGTTYSAIALMEDNGYPAVIQNADGKATMPSVVYFGGAEPLVGDGAKAYKAVGDDQVADFFKRQMGEATWSLDFGGRSCSAVDLSALVLARLKKDAEEATGRPITSAVVTVPAYFNDNQRRATMKAAELAGLNITRVINEPTAAALAYARRNKGVHGRYLVYDLGGGTFDVTVLVYTGDGNDRVLAVAGDHRLGGKDWDDALFRHLDTEFQQRAGFTVRDDPVAIQELSLRCEEAKQQLSSRESVTVRVMANGQVEMIPVTRGEFEELTRDLLHQTFLRVETALEEAVDQAKDAEWTRENKWEKLDGILLVGGSTRMPQVKRLLEKHYGRPVLGGINVDEAVALGAAIQADADARGQDDVRLLKGTSTPQPQVKMRTMADVMSHSLGVVAENKDRSAYLNSILIPKNTPIPCSHTLPYTLRTRKDKDNALDVYVLQGELESPLECAVIRKCIMNGIVHQQGGRAVLDVTYAYNESGIVDVSAVQRGAGALRVQEEPVEVDLSWMGRSPRERDPEPEVPHITVWLAFDVSYSMNDEPIKSARDAGTQFLKKIDLSHSSVGVVAFSDRVDELVAPCQDGRRIRRALDQLPDIVSEGRCGFGNEAIPFQRLLTKAPRDGEPCFIVLLTDGIWDHQPEAIDYAARCHQAGLEVVAMGFGGANQAFLKAIATSDEAAIFTDLSRLGECFSRIAQVLSEDGSLTASQGQATSGKKGLFSGLRNG